MKWTKEQDNTVKNNIYKISNKEIGLILNRSESSIQHRAERLGLLVPKYKQACLNGIELEILDGMLLADASLEQSKISARITYGCKYEETLSDIEVSFPKLHFSPKWFNKKESSYHFKSGFYTDLLQERKRWYPHGIKIVPQDIKITPLSCYWWFIGDGYRHHYGATLCTDAFDYEDVYFLIDKIQILGFKAKRTSNNRIKILSESVSQFLEWLSKYNKISTQYLYKWSNQWKIASYHKKQL